MHARTNEDNTRTEPPRRDPTITALRFRHKHKRLIAIIVFFFYSLLFPFWNRTSCPHRNRNITSWYSRAPIRSCGVGIILSPTSIVWTGFRWPGFYFIQSITGLFDECNPFCLFLGFLFFFI